MIAGPSRKTDADAGHPPEKRAGKGKCAAFILKCTRECNFRCAYCLDRRESHGSIDLGLMGKLTKEALAGFDNVDFIFHGGEPLLLGIDYFRKVLALQTFLAHPGQGVRNIIQTNGSLVDEAWADFFREKGVHVGISLDGPAEVHDTFRRYRGGKASFADCMRGIGTLREAGVHRFGILAVANERLVQSEPRDIFAFFSQSLGIEEVTPPEYYEVSFIPERPPQPSFANVAEARRFYEGRARYAHFMCSLLESLMERDNPALHIRELTSKLDSLVGGRTRVCTEDGPCVGTYFGLDPSGVVSHCDTFFDEPRFCFGDLHEQTLGEMRASSAFAQAMELERSLRDECRPCRWYANCQGGCLYEALLFNQSGLAGRPAFCHSRRIYDFMSKELGRLFETAMNGAPLPV